MSRHFIGFFAALLLCPALALAQYAGPNTSPRKGMSPASVALLRNALAGTGAQPIYIPAGLGIQAAQLQDRPATALSIACGREGEAPAEPRLEPGHPKNGLAGASPSRVQTPPARQQPQFKFAMISDSPAVPTQPAAPSQPSGAAQNNAGEADATNESYVAGGGYVDVMHAAHLLLDGGYARNVNPLTGGRYPGSMYLARTYQVSPQSSLIYNCSGPPLYGPFGIYAAGCGFDGGYGCGPYSSYGWYGPPRFDGLGIYPCAYGPFGPPHYGGFGIYPLSGWPCDYGGYGYGFGGYGSYPFFSNLGTGFFRFNGVVINSGFRFSGNFTTGAGVFRVRLGF